MTQFVLANQTPQDEVGRTLPKAMLYFYDNNTFNFKDVYSDTARTSVLPNPVIADGDGRFPAIYLAVNSNYRVWLKDRFDKQVTPFIDNQGESAQGLGTAAYVNTGTGASDVPLNSNLGSAAYSDLVPTPTSTNAGAALSYDSYQYNQDFGLGNKRELKNKSGSNVAPNAILAGSNFEWVQINSAGATVGVGSGPAGSWKNTNGNTIANNSGGSFQRVL